jgi:dTDP-4-amino-4,6-dideoxygalactose transaminase
LPDPVVAAAAAAAMASGAWGQYRGEYVPALERELAEFHGVPHALTCASGTLAIETALRALKVGPGDEVVMAAYDYEPNFLGIHAVGATPVLVDVSAGDWNLDAAALSEAFSPKTRAVLCSHLHGGSVPMRAVMELARPRGIGVIEDSCQSPGAVVQGKPAGTWGDVGVLSFGGSKLLTAGRGGALLFADAQLHHRARSWLNRGLQQWAPLSELQAAVLRPQLRSLRQATETRWQRVHELMSASDGLGSVAGLRMFPFASEGSVPAFYKVGFQYDPGAFGISRELFVAAMRAEGIAFDAGFKALHAGRSPSRFRAGGLFTNAEHAHERCVTLHHPVLTTTMDEVRQVAEAVHKVARAAAAGLFTRADSG